MINYAKRHPFTCVALITTLATCCVVSNAYLTCESVYDGIVHLTKSNMAIAVIYMQLLLFFVFVVDLLRVVLFGKVQSVEADYVMDRIWFTIPETIIAFTIFRDSFGFWFGCHLILLMFAKSSHWLYFARIDYMERMMLISKTFHLRSNIICFSLLSLDIYSCYRSAMLIESVDDGINVIFLFEYLLMGVYAMYTFSKYIVHTIDSRNSSNWEHKTIYMMVLQIIFNFVSMVLFFLYSLTIVVFKSYPLFLVRRLFASIRGFKRSFVTILKSRRAIERMNKMFKDVIQTDLEGVDSCCIICREDMDVVQNCKKLPCGHMFHIACLRSWLRRQQICPTCRLDLLQEPANITRNQNPVPRENVADNNGNRVINDHIEGLRDIANRVQTELSSNAQVSTAQFGFPPPPPQLRNLSQKELGCLEKKLRNSTVNRVRLLMDINILLDAATFQFQQYESLIDEERIHSIDKSTQTTDTTNNPHEPPRYNNQNQ